MDWHATGNPDGTLTLGPIIKANFRKYLAENGPCRILITHELPESGKLRRFYHGAVLPLWAFLDGKDCRDRQLLADMHELAKIEFNGVFVTVNGEARRIGRSSKGWQLQEFVERIIAYLEDNYGIERSVVLDPEDYKHFIGTVYMHGKHETYIDYMIDCGKLKRT